MSADLQSSSNIHNRYSDNTENLKVFSIPSIMGRCQHTDWDACEMFRLQELNEARQRAAQMEKTMRWWSECTASWRQKWCSVRNERNEAREEAFALKEALKSANDEIKNLQTEKRNIEIDLAKTKAHIFQLQKDCILSGRHQESSKNFKTTSLIDDESNDSRPLQVDASTNTDLAQISIMNSTLETSARATEACPSTKRVQMFQSIGYVRELQAQLSDVFDDLEKMKVSSEVEASRTSNHLNRTICLHDDTAAPLPSPKEFEMVKCERDEAISEVQTLRMEKEFLMRQLKMLKKTVEHAFLEPPMYASNSNVDLQLLDSEAVLLNNECPSSVGEQNVLVPSNDDGKLAANWELRNFTATLNQSHPVNAEQSNPNGNDTEAVLELFNGDNVALPNISAANNATKLSNTEEKYFAKKNDNKSANPPVMEFEHQEYEVTEYGVKADRAQPNPSEATDEKKNE